MALADASFGVRVLSPSAADRADLDAALAIYTRNTSPLLRTRTNQIRWKLQRPKTPEGTFYFVAFYRGSAVIGFAMFGYYPRTRLVAIDHLVVEPGQRGAGAFYVFAQLLSDLISNLGLEVDFAVVEVERHNEFGGNQTGGDDLVRLLGQVGFGEVHTDYLLPNMDPKNYESRYQGSLMLRGPEKIHNIRREDLVEIYRSIIYDHYFPWFRDFFGADTADYKAYLDRHFAEFEARLKDTPIVRVNGEASDQLLAPPVRAQARSPEVRTLAYTLIFGLCSAVLVGVLYALKVPMNIAPAVVVGFLVVFAGIVSISNGRAFDVFERALLSLPFGTHKSNYLRSPGRQAGAGRVDPQTRLARRSSAASSGGTKS